VTTNEGPKRSKSSILSTKAIFWTAVVLVATAGLLAAALLWAYGGGTDADRARLDAIRTAASVAIGTGGAAALLLAARRQRFAEIDIQQKGHDATERRITELFTKAVEQLGSDKAPVRLGGLYSLERLAQENCAHRQTIVNVICAYLRMPFIHPDETSSGRSKILRADALSVADTSSAQGDMASIGKGEADRSKEELEVRQAAQRILGVHLKSKRGGAGGLNVEFWGGVSLDLTGATLVAFDASDFDVVDARFGGAIFHQESYFANFYCRNAAWFAFAEFRGNAWFAEGRFDGEATFLNAKFKKSAVFQKYTFNGLSNFGFVKFESISSFQEAEFEKQAFFAASTLAGQAQFHGVKFNGGVAFNSCKFESDAVFQGASNDGRADFVDTEFRGSVDLARLTDVHLDRGRVLASSPERIWPSGWVELAGKDEKWHTVVREG
jgi:hypothetical protein